MENEPEQGHVRTMKRLKKKLSSVCFWIAVVGKNR